MTRPKTVASLFEEEPMHWGLRGDPFLWKEMRDRFEQIPLPGTSDELIALIDKTFESLTGHSMSELNMFFVERFNQGGMSGGYISPEFWREEILPLIRALYFEMKSLANE